MPEACMDPMLKICKAMLPMVEQYREMLEGERDYEAEYGHGYDHWSRMMREADETIKEAKAIIAKAEVIECQQ